MAQAEYDNALQCEESDEQLVRELIKFKIYGEATTLDGIIEAAKKNLNETKARIAKLKTLFGGEEIDQTHLGIVPGFSTESEVRACNAKVNKEDETILKNRVATSAINVSLHDLAGEMNDTEYKDIDFPEIEENNSHTMPGTIRENSKETSLDVFLPEESHQDGVHIDVVSDVGGEPKPDTNTDTKLSVSLIHSEAKTVDKIAANQVEGERCTTYVLDKNVVKNCSSDVEVWNDGCPLPSGGHTCSERQSTDDVHSSGAEAISTQVSSATGSPPECEEPRSGCVNIESVMSSEQVSHLPSFTSINEQSEDSVKGTSNVEVVQDDENIAALHSFPQYQNKVEDDKIVATGNSLLSKNRDEQENDQCQSTEKKNNVKKKGKVDKKEKRLKG